MTPIRAALLKPLITPAIIASTTRPREYRHTNPKSFMTILLSVGMTECLKRLAGFRFLVFTISVDYFSPANVWDRPPRSVAHSYSAGLVHPATRVDRVQGAFPRR